jgi:23S rRNA (guanosine2251-2'-O)-methyltransferase
VPYFCEEALGCRLQCTTTAYNMEQMKKRQGGPDKRAKFVRARLNWSEHHHPRTHDRLRGNSGASKPFSDAPRQPDRSRTEAPRPVDHGQLVFGIEPLRELLAATPQAVRVLYIRSGAEARFRREAEIVSAAGGRVLAADNETMRRMAGSEARHQGLVALVEEYQYASLDEVIAAQPDPLLLIDGVTDPRNLGAILRSAEGAGVSTVVLARDRTAGLTPAAIKSSAGAWVHLRIARCGNVVRTLERLKESGYWVVALAPQGTLSLYELDVGRKLVVIVGAEGGGVRDLVGKRSDFVVRIPMAGRVNSLNAAVAAALACFEIGRRRSLPADT